MITRHYFISVEINESNYWKWMKFTHKSFFPEHNKVFDEILTSIEVEFNVSRDRIKILAFNRI